MLPGRKYTPEEIVRILWFRKRILFSSLFVCMSLAVGVSLRLPNHYRSETLILVIPQRVPESYVHSTVTVRIEDRLRSISQQILSRSRLEKVIDELNLYTEARKGRALEDIVEQMRADIIIETVRDDAFRLSFTADMPRTAMIVTDRLASMFIDENTHDREAMAEGTNQFLERQLDDARQRLIGHEKKLEEFRQRNSGELPSQLQMNLQVIQGSQNQIQNVTESINRDRDRRLVLERSIAGALASDVQAAVGPDGPGGSEREGVGPERAIDQLERARTDLRAMELRFKPGHPDVIAKKRLIVELERKVQEEGSTRDGVAGKPTTTAEVIRQARARQYQVEMDKLDRQIAGKESEVERLNKVVVDYQRRVESVPGHESELTELMRDYETLQKIYASLLAKKEDSRISSNLERAQVGEQFKILDPARLPEKPFSPNRVQIGGVAAALGLLFGVGVAAYLEYHTTGLRTEDEIVRTLVLPVLAAIPIMTAVADRNRHRRRVLVSIAATLAVVLLVAAASLWHFGLLKGIH